MISKISSLFSIRTLVLAIVASSGLLLSACSKAETQSEIPSKPVPTAPVANVSTHLSTDEQKVSYGIGFNIGSDMARQKGLEIDRDALQAGITDAISSSPTRVEEAELKAAFAVIQQRMMATMAKEAKKKMAVGAEYLAKNKTREGVVETASGLQYEVISSGTGGAKPKATDKVVVHYRGTLMDGTVFDSTIERGEPAGFPVNQVIPGWTEALQLMSVGDKWKLFVPANLAYGQQARPNIPAYSLLIFEVELLNIVEQKTVSPTAEAPASATKPQ